MVTLYVSDCVATLRLVFLLDRRSLSLCLSLSLSRLYSTVRQVSLSLPAFPSRLPLRLFFFSFLFLWSSDFAPPARLFLYQATAALSLFA